jgi:hypothetical protein
MMRCRKEFLSSKWLSINEQFVYREIVKYVKITELRSSGKLDINWRIRLEI